MLALMICSQIMLTGFVSYWLIAQYRQERLHLHARLQDMYYSAYDAQVDSLLVTHLIAPTLNDSVTLSVDLSRMPHIYPGTDSVRTAVVIKQLDEDNLAGPDVFAFRMADSVGIEEERMVRSVRLFINKTEESFRNDTLAHAFSMKIDSTALLKMLNERFEEMDWNFTMYWQPESIQSGNAPGNHGMVLSSGPHMELTALHIDHITPYLLGLMLPQFIFALLLLGLSASALIIAYRSLKKQVALNILRNDFMANISHELKTPVSTVKVALEALQKFDLKKDPKVSGDYLDLASREVDRLEGLVGDVQSAYGVAHPHRWICTGG